MSVPSIVEALHTLTAEIVRSEEFRTALRDVVSEVLAARPTEMVSVETFAAEHSLCTATVRAMIRDGRLQATRIGKRAVRIRRDATIGRSASGPAPPGAETPAAIADRILARLR
jgi:excisionase family DNA binding protein